MDRSPTDTQYACALIDAYVPDAGEHHLTFDEALALAEARNTEAADELMYSYLDHDTALNLEAAAAVAALP